MCLYRQMEYASSDDAFPYYFATRCSRKQVCSDGNIPVNLIGRFSTVGGRSWLFEVLMQGHV